MSEDGRGVAFQHAENCPALGSSEGALCTCTKLPAFVKKLKALRESKCTTVVSYKFRTVARDEFEDNGEWGTAERLPLLFNEASEGVHLKLGSNVIVFPSPGFEYKEMKCVPQRTLELCTPEAGMSDAGLPSGGLHGFERNDETREEKKSRAEAKGIPLDPEKFETLVPYMLTEQDRMLTQTILANRFQIAHNDGIKAKKLAMFMAWGRSIDMANPESMKLGEELYKALRVADIAFKTGKPEWLVHKQLEGVTSEDPYVKVEQALGKKGPVGGGGVFRGGRSNWASRPSYQRPAKPPRPPRTCKFCGDVTAEDWDDHKCPKKPK